MARRKGQKKQQSKRGRDGYLKKTYNISEVEYEKLAEAYKGACWICDRKPKTGRKLNVDHDHKLQKIAGVRASVRGVLCFMCNKRLIGRRRREHAPLFTRAAEYLTSDKAQQILGG